MTAFITIPASSEYGLLIPRVTIANNTEVIELANIPQTYKHLKIVGMINPEGFSTGCVLNMILNDDLTAGNYNNGGVDRTGTTWTAFTAFDGALGAQIATINSQITPYTQPSLFEIDVWNYSSVAFHKQIWSNLHNQRVTNAVIRQHFGQIDYRSLVAITNIKFDSGLGNAFDSGSYYEVYGLGKV